MKIEPQIAHTANCSGCMACVDICPVGAISGKIDIDGFLMPQIDHQKCIKCGKCTKVCPTATKYTPQPTPHLQPYAAWGNDRKMRHTSASGGVFATIAKGVIERGGVVVGAVINGTEVTHEAINKIEDLHKLQGSKYQQGDLRTIYKQVGELLKAGRTVLFSGMGCQVAAMISYARTMSYSGKLLTIDIICGGFPSLTPTGRFVDHFDIRSIKSFRDKTTGWKAKGYKYSLVCEDSNGTQHNFGYKNIVLGAFRSHLYHRQACNNCQFARLQRESDLTTADFWGDTKHPEQHYDGLSVIVVHTQQGKELVAQSDLSTAPTDWSFIKRNGRAVNGDTSYLNNSLLRRIVRKITTHGTIEDLEILYKVTKTPIWHPQILIRIYIKICQIFTKLRHKRNIKKALQTPIR